MTTWHEYAQRNGSLPEWPYPIRYGEERVIQTDVLVLGGGIAGCHAALNARRSGARVVVLEKAATKWSGNGGAGVDHWLAACAIRALRYRRKITAQAIGTAAATIAGRCRYINAKDGWDTLLDCEQMGVQIRDVHDEFKGAAFRDDDSRLLFAYDYQAKMDLRVYGWNMKPSLHKEMKRLRVQILDRVMVTALLTEENDQGKRVVGAMGLHTRTGEFIIVQARATIYATGLPGRIWVFSTEHRPTFRDPNLACDGMAAVWNAGAEFTVSKRRIPTAARCRSSPMAWAMPTTPGTAARSWMRTARGALGGSRRERAELVAGTVPAFP